MPITLINLMPANTAEECCTRKAAHNAYGYARIRTRLGWRSIDSPYAPGQEARSITDCIRPAHTRVLMLGAGSGYVADEIIKKKIPEVVIVTASKSIAEKNVRRIKTDPTCTTHFTIITTPGVTPELRRRIAEFITPDGGIQIVRHTRESNAFPEIFNPLEVYARGRLKAHTLTARQPPRRVLFPHTGRDLIEPEMIRELRRRGCQVIGLGSLDGQHLSARQAWDLLELHRPDLVVSKNNNGSDRAGMIPETCAQAEIPWATWFFDDPRFLVAPTEHGSCRNRHAFCWDLAGIDACRELEYGTPIVLPIGTDHRHFTPGSGDPGLAGRIVFVGSPSFGNEAAYFACLENNPHASRLAKALQDQVCGTRRLPSQPLIDDAMRECRIAPESFQAESLRRLPAYVLYRANLHYRVSAIRALAGLRPIVYGKGWNGLLPETVELRPPLDYYGDLLQVYRSDAVHISMTHLQMRSHPNQRVFDVGACARFVLNDRLPSWSSLFGNRLGALVYGDFHDLRDRADYFASEPGARVQVAEKLHEQVLLHHTIQHRIDRMMYELYGTRG